MLFSRMSNNFFYYDEIRINYIVKTENYHIYISYYFYFTLFVEDTSLVYYYYQNTRASNISKKVKYLPQQNPIKLRTPM